VLESEGLPCSAVSGCAGVERFVLVFEGRASHAGTTPMDARRDAGLAAANVALAVEQIARDAGGVGTTGALELEPGIVTAVAGRAELSVDLRHGEDGPLAAMLEAVREVAARVAAGRECSLSERHVWRIEPIPFDPDLVATAALCCSKRGGRERPLRSGALHDAAEMARRLPVAMIFSSSTEGVSHNRVEDTPEADLHAAIAAFGDLAAIALHR
jgi:N-carbamoyl-L-amino-acid hydrolase